MRGRVIKPNGDVDDIGVRAREIGERLGQTGGSAAAVYDDLAPNGRKLSRKEAARAREQLVAIALCLRDIHDDDGIVTYLAAEGRRSGRDTDLRPTISLMRMIQRGLGLALSDDPSRREQAMSLGEISKFAIPVARFWREL